jgi:hypothetical protein
MRIILKCILTTTADMPVNQQLHKENSFLAELERICSNSQTISVQGFMLTEN